MYPAGVIAARANRVWDLAAGPGLSRSRALNVLSQPSADGRILVNRSDASTYADAVFDGALVDSPLAATVRNGPGGVMRLLAPRFVNAPWNHINQVGEQLDILDGYLGSCGLRPPPDAHMEQVFIHAGRVRVIGTLFDGRGLAGPFTALLFAKTDISADNPIDVTILGSVFAGAPEIVNGKGQRGIPFPIQAGPKLSPITLRIGGCAIQRGTQGYIGCTAHKSIPMEIADLGGNVDFDTGAPIDLTWPARADPAAAVRAERDALAAKLAVIRQAAA